MAAPPPSLTSTLLALTTPTATALAVPHPPLPPHAECQLLGPFALLVQLALGGLALLALVYKRWRERPQRPVKVWAFDVSKQVVGSVLVHVANLVMSMLSSGEFGVTLETVAKLGGGEGGESNSCSFYFLNLLIDVSICLFSSCGSAIGDWRLTRRRMESMEMGRHTKAIERQRETIANPPY